MTRFKGPLFPSFLHQDRRGPGHKQWIPHQGTRQKLRALRNQCKTLLESPEAQDMIGRISHAVAHEPEPEYARLHLMVAGLHIVEESTGVTWLEAMAYLMDKFEAMEDGTTEPYNASDIQA